MSQKSHLLNSLQQALSSRAQKGLTVFCLDQPLPSHAPDFFSNDYLSLSTDQSIRDIFLRKIQAAAPACLFGSRGSRLGTGGSTEFNALEKGFQQFFSAPSALLFPSGFEASFTFLSTVPQKDDVIIYDEFVHPSAREGIRLSSCSSYRFVNNSLTSLKECVLGVLQNHPQVTQGTSTVFLLVESLYSMDGCFCPLQEIVELMESLVPAGRAHIVIDEAHTSGVCGPNGTGYVTYLGLNERVHTKIHTLGKGWGYHGAVVLTSPIIRAYLINFGKGVMFSTAMPYTDIYALESCLEVVGSARGEELRQRLYRLSRYANRKICTTLCNVPETILVLSRSDVGVGANDPALCSPIIPVFTPHAGKLADYLLERGYGVSPMTYPVVKKPRIRITIHSGNTEKEIDALMDELLTWAVQHQGLASAGDVCGSEGADRVNEKAKASL